MGLEEFVRLRFSLELLNGRNIAGDVIRAANNRRITSSDQFEKLIADLPENEKINVDCEREQVSIHRY